MKILHTADWHLGKRLDNFLRHDEQVKVLAEIEQIADDEAVDVIIIAGDLYDSIQPSLESQSLFYKTLKRLAKDGSRPVIAIAGNHDSPDRIDSPDPLAKECGIIFIGKPKAVVQPITIAGKFQITNSVAGLFELELPNHPPLRIIHTAYANEHRLKEYLGEDKALGLNEVLQTHWQELADTYCDAKGINILTTHLYMQKLGTVLEAEPEGEKPLNIGNADVVYSNIIPAQIQYTALGHLHRNHNIGTEEHPIVYSSSPLAYSFAEAHQTKYVVIVEAEADKPITYKNRALQSGRTLYKKSFDNINEAVNWLTENPYALVELTIYAENFLTPAELKQLHEAHDGIIFIIPKIKNQKQEQSSNHQDIDLNKDVTALFEDYFTARENMPPNQELLDILKEIITE